MSRQEENVLAELAQAEASGDKQKMAAAHLQLGHLYKKTGQLEQAEAAYRLARELAAKLGHGPLEADAYSGWGLVCEVRGNVKQAWERIMDSYEINKMHGDRGRLADNYSNLGFLAQIQGDFDDAERLYGYALHLREELADRAGRALVRCALLCEPGNSKPDIAPSVDTVVAKRQPQVRGGAMHPTRAANHMILPLTRPEWPGLRVRRMLVEIVGPLRDIAAQVVDTLGVRGKSANGRRDRVVVVVTKDDPANQV